METDFLSVYARKSISLDTAEISLNEMGAKRRELEEATYRLYKTLSNTSTPRHSQNFYRDTAFLVNSQIRQYGANEMIAECMLAFLVPSLNFRVSEAKLDVGNVLMSLKEARQAAMKSIRGAMLKEVGESAVLQHANGVLNNCHDLLRDCLITETEAGEYLKLVKDLFKRAKSDMFKLEGDQT